MLAVCATVVWAVLLFHASPGTLSLAAADLSATLPVRSPRATVLPPLPFVQHPTVTPATPVDPLPDTPSPSPVTRCTAVFPIERVEELMTRSWTIPQLEAAFGRAVSVGGRATRLRFVSQGCTLLITPGSTLTSDTIQETELVDYGSLEWLLARYGDPAAIGVTQGNLVMPLTGYTALLYPERGVIALFAAGPESLLPDMPVASLFFRPPYALDAQVRRLNLRLVDR